MKSKIQNRMNLELTAVLLGCVCWLRKRRLHKIPPFFNNKLKNIFEMFCEKFRLFEFEDSDFQTVFFLIAPGMAAGVVGFPLAAAVGGLRKFKYKTF